MHWWAELTSRRWLPLPRKPRSHQSRPSAQAVRAGPSAALDAGVLDAARLGNPGDAGAGGGRSCRRCGSPSCARPLQVLQPLMDLLIGAAALCHVQEANMAITSWTSADKGVSSLLLEDYWHGTMSSDIKAFKCTELLSHGTLRASDMHHCLLSTCAHHFP